MLNSTAVCAQQQLAAEGGALALNWLQLLQHAARPMGGPPAEGLPLLAPPVPAAPAPLLDTAANSAFRPPERQRVLHPSQQVNRVSRLLLCRPLRTRAVQGDPLAPTSAYAPPLRRCPRVRVHFVDTIKQGGGCFRRSKAASGWLCFAEIARSPSEKTSVPWLCPFRILLRSQPTKPVRTGCALQTNLDLIAGLLGLQHPPMPAAPPCPPPQPDAPSAEVLHRLLLQLNQQVLPVQPAPAPVGSPLQVSPRSSRCNAFRSRRRQPKLPPGTAESAATTATLARWPSRSRTAPAAPTRRPPARPAPRPAPAPRARPTRSTPRRCPSSGPATPTRPTATTPST